MYYNENKPKKELKVMQKTNSQSKDLTVSVKEAFPDVSQNDDYYNGIDPFDAAKFDRYMEYCRGSGEGFGECNGCPGLQLSTTVKMNMRLSITAIGNWFWKGHTRQYPNGKLPCETEMRLYCPFIGMCKATREVIS